jgi:ribosomal protein L34E
MNEPDGISEQSLETLVEHFLNAIVNTSVDVDASLNGALRDSFLEINPYKHVLSEEGKQQLQQAIFNANMKNTHCPITLEEFNIGDNVITLPCEHVFNKEAIQKWLTEEKSICPLCRYELKSILVKRPNELTELASQTRMSTSHGRSVAGAILQQIMEQQIQDEEEAMMQITIQNSLLQNTSVNDLSSNDLSSNDLSANDI